MAATREIISRIDPDAGAFSLLKFESGTHRVQRVPATEAQGRIHTSACTVAILPELDEVEAVELEPRGAAHRYLPRLGRGQAARQQDRLGHPHHAYLPTGIVVECQDERSQHKNRSRAHVPAEIPPARRRTREAGRASRRRPRKLQVGSGDRSERIRTYNFLQGRVTDHRINLDAVQARRCDERQSRRTDPGIESGAPGRRAGAARGR